MQKIQHTQRVNFNDDEALERRGGKSRENVLMYFYTFA